MRRSALLYATLFLLIAGGSYAGLAIVEEPAPSVENPRHTLTVNDTFDVDGRTYSVSGVSAQTDSNGNLQRSGTVRWVNQSARYTATWENNSTVSFQGQTYRVLVPNVSDPSSVTLREVRNRTAILRNDSAARNEVVTSNGGTFVVVKGDDERNLVPADEYFSSPATTEYGEGQTIDYRGNATTVANVTTDAATLAWTAPRTNAVDLGTTTALETVLVRGGEPTNLDTPAGSNVTLNGATLAAHYPDNGTVVLSSTPGSYQEQVSSARRLHERINGIWAVFIISSLTTVLLLALSFLPSTE